jgi:hypothetical protein
MQVRQKLVSNVGLNPTMRDVELLLVAAYFPALMPTYGQQKKGWTLLVLILSHSPETGAST